jgi:hypothetical protein
MTAGGFFAGCGRLIGETKMICVIAAAVRRMARRRPAKHELAWVVAGAVVASACVATAAAQTTGGAQAPSGADASRTAVIAPEADEGSEVTIEVRGASRREAVTRLFAPSATVIEWRNAAFADQPVSGRFVGTLTEVARRLLDGGDYVIVYHLRRDQPTVARVVVLGPSSKLPAAVAGPQLLSHAVSIARAPRGRRLLSPIPLPKSTRG